MEKIRIGNKEQLYDIVSIRPVSANVIRIVFDDEIPAAYGTFTIYTSGGDEATTLTGYDTVYRDEGHTVCLSNDGSVYVAPEVPEGPTGPSIPYEPTIDELRASKRHEVSADCEKAIYSGVSVTLTDGSTEHYSLTEHDQLNLFGKQSQIAVGMAQLEYHADGQPCRYYSAADMLSIIQAAMWHVSYHTTYCNALNMWIAGTGAAEELQVIFYGADVPEPYQSDVLRAYLLQIAGMTEENSAQSKD